MYTAQIEAIAKTVERIQHNNDIMLIAVSVIGTAVLAGLVVAFVVNVIRDIRN